MNEFQSKKNGGRRLYTEDINDLQQLALSVTELFKAKGITGGFVLSGCEIGEQGGFTHISAGYVWLAGKVRQVPESTFDGLSPIVYIEPLSAEGGEVLYENGDTGPRNISYKARFRGVRPDTSEYITSVNGAFPDIRAMFDSYTLSTRKTNVFRKDVLDSEVNFNKVIARSVYATSTLNVGATNVAEALSKLSGRVADAEGRIASGTGLAVELGDFDSRFSQDEMAKICAGTSGRVWGADCGQITFFANATASGHEGLAVLETNGTKDIVISSDGRIAVGESGIAGSQGFTDGATKLRKFVRPFTLTGSLVWGAWSQEDDSLTAAELADMFAQRDTRISTNASDIQRIDERNAAIESTGIIHSSGAKNPHAYLSHYLPIGVLRSDAEICGGVDADGNFIQKEGIDQDEIIAYFTEKRLRNIALGNEPCFYQTRNGNITITAEIFQVPKFDRNGDPTGAMDECVRANLIWKYLFPLEYGTMQDYYPQSPVQCIEYGVFLPSAGSGHGVDNHRKGAWVNFEQLDSTAAVGILIQN